MWVIKPTVPPIGVRNRKGDTRLPNSQPTAAASSSRARVAYLDRLRLLAMVGVVAVHVGALYATDLAAGGQALGFAWHLANLLDAAGRVAVPIFLMITGALLLGSDSSLSPQLVWRRRIVRVALPLLVWSAVYIVLGALTVPDYQPLEAVKRLIGKPAEIHLWYLYALIAVYLLLPLLRLLVKHASRRALLYVLGLWIVFSCLWRAAAGLLPALALPDYANLDILGGYAGYVLLGWVLATIRKGPPPAFCLALFLAGVAVTACGTWVMTGRAGELNGVFYQYFMPNVAAAATGLFLLLRRGSRAAGEAPAWVSRAAGLSFGVYLSHLLFLRLLYPLFTRLPMPAAVQQLLLLPAVLAAALLFTALVSAVPGLRFAAFGLRNRAE